MSNLTLTQAQYVALKRQATIHERMLRQCVSRMREPGGPDAVERRAVADRCERFATEALRTFDEQGYPDDWHRWHNLLMDAQMLAARSW